MKEAEMVDLIELFSEFSLQSFDESPLFSLLIRLSKWPHPGSAGGGGAVVCESDLVRFLIEEVGEVNVRDSPLSPYLYHTACECGLPSLCRLLCEWGVDVDYTNSRGQTPLHRAVANEQKEICKALLIAGANVDQRDDDGWAPLHFASSVEICVLLLSCGASIDSQDHLGMTPLHKAAATNSLPRFELFLSFGVDPNLRSRSGTTPLHCAARADRDGNLCDLLLRHGADPNVQDNEGWAPLHVAAEAGNWNACVVLLSRGADRDLLNFDSESPARVANGHGSARMRSILGSDFQL